MLSTAIIIFREAFEIALILGVLLAATRGSCGRKRWVLSGLAAGTLGSMLVAYFAQSISQMAEGMGQELFNAAVLLLAAFLIGWTVVWMARYGRTMTQHFKEVGRAVCEGQKPLYTLGVVVALAVLREGSEIVLFIFGLSASGEAVPAIVSGSAIGALAGVAAGGVIYYGLIKISPKHFFSVTSWLLIFLAAGMVSQAAGYLSAGGFIPELVPQVWDSSAWLPESGWAGQVLHALLGYSERPSGIQLASYLITAGGIVSVLKWFGSAPQPKKSGAGTGQKMAAAVFIMLSAGLLAWPQDAHAVKRVYLPYVEKGELEIEHKGQYRWDDDEDIDGAQAYLFSVGYNFTDVWFSEVGVELAKARHHDTKAEVIEWENRFQISETGAWWADTGLLLEYEFALHGDDPDKIEGKLLFAKEVDVFLHALNVTLESELGGTELNDEGAEVDQEHDLEGGFSWSSRYRLRQEFEPGVEYHADFGSLEHGEDFEEQKHQVGPVVYGKIGPVKYDAGVLFGVSDAAADVELKWIVEYEFRF